MSIKEPSDWFDLAIEHSHWLWDFSVCCLEMFALGFRVASEQAMSAVNKAPYSNVRFSKFSKFRNFTSLWVFPEVTSMTGVSTGDMT